MMLRSPWLGLRMQFDRLRRRQFITLLGGAAAWPLAARAQQPAMPVIGWLGSTSAGGQRHRVAEFREGLREQGFVERQNITIEYRWADDHNERLPQLAADLVASRVAVIVSSGGSAAALAAKAATATIPIVFAIAADPVRAGLVTSLSRPEGNITGVVGFTDTLIAKRLELVTELLPNVVVIGALLNPNNPNAESRSSDLRAAAGAIGRQVRFVYAGIPGELEKAFTTAVEQRLGALIIQNDLLFISRRDEVAGLATRHRLPTIQETREYAEVGGLMSYGPSISDRYRLLSRYTAKVLRGEKPADLPVVQPTKFELVINLKTAKALGLVVPTTLLARADEVIE
jgi:putative ABC transport system substrate-binding protein